LKKNLSQQEFHVIINHHAKATWDQQRKNQQSISPTYKIQLLEKRTRRNIVLFEKNEAGTVGVNDAHEKHRHDGSGSARLV
jgi:type 1 glutamine amidotransferase